MLDAEGIAAIDGLLLDLGVSSPQLDDASRGFSLRTDGPLDMRMDPTRGKSAAEWLAQVTESELKEVIADYGEERFAQQIARAIIAARAHEPVVRTRQLAAIVAKAVGAGRGRDRGQDPATRTFQAIRIYINQELAELSLALDRALPRLAAGGRLAVISFHSLEDRHRQAVPPPPQSNPTAAMLAWRGCPSRSARCQYRRCAGGTRDPCAPGRSGGQPAIAQRQLARRRAARRDRTSW